MKRILLFLILFFCFRIGFSQAYIPMPADTAVWRYRSFNDVLTVTIDNILFLDGADTLANGYAYHKIMTRSFMQTGPAGFNPPVVSVEANSPDTYYGAMREGGKKVYILSGTSEKLMFDFNAGVGDSIPAYLSKIKVAAIDSVSFGGVYHKRYLTTDPGYYVIEGVGSSRGLIPDLDDGSADIAFYCFTHTPVIYSPDTTIPCTEIYPIGHEAAVNSVDHPVEITVYPNPANDELHIMSPLSKAVETVIVNSIGHVIWQGSIIKSSCISVRSWPRGIYFVRFTSVALAPTVITIILE